ncbi:VCBS repeat-containing protein [Streptomyces sp. NRRL S-87]|uniref:FG-GAP repeat domain-containing protein n=1 Tax=Streptomyces sp. NRRL S-87 TaxID=1463920 RepID=UPI00068B8801|nr:VCBS repeat-containing protein [Streptomyces sp. NRRL S-87]
MFHRPVTETITRTGLLAAGTALALSAGLLLAGPGAAAATAPARTALATPTGPAASAARPHGPGGRLFEHAFGPAVRPQDSHAAARARAKPLHDIDLDGVSDLISQENDGSTWAWPTRTGSEPKPFTVKSTDPAEQFVDFIPVGNLGAELFPEFLTLSSDGRLSLYSAIPDRTTTPYWVGRGWQAYNKVVAPGDLTKDGKPDLLARTFSGDLYLYKGTGSLTGTPFAPRVRVGTGWGAYDQLIGANDVDGDGVGDVLARSLDGTLWFFKGTGSATAPLRTRTKVGTGWNTYNQIVAADDQNGDGLADLYARKRNGYVYTYDAKGGGTFAAPRRGGSGWDGTCFLIGAGTTQVYGRSQALAVRAADRSWWKLENTANGRFDDPDEIDWDPGTKPAAGGRFAYATALHHRNHASFVTQYGSKLTIAGRVASTSWTYDTTVGPGDLTGDGKGDLLALGADGILWLYPGDGAYQTRLGARIKVGGGWGPYRHALFGAGDYSGDGRADLFARGAAGLFLYKGTGSAARPFERPVKVAGPRDWSGYNAVVTPGDLDGDGRSDLVARDAAGDVWRYSSTGRSGTATLRPRVKIASGWNVYGLFF